MNIYYVDWGIYNLKMRKRNSQARNFLPVTRLFETMDKMKEESMVFIRELALMLFKENEIFITDGKVSRVQTRLAELMLKKNSFKCFLQYFFLILLHNDTFTNFSSVIVEIFEDWVSNSIALLSENGRTDELSIFSLLYILYEIFCWNFRSGVCYFSAKFMRFISNLGLWHSEQFWEKAIAVCSEFGASRELCFYVDVLKQKPHKARLKSNLSIYRMLIYIAFCFLKLPLGTVLDMFNKINDRKNHVSVNQIFDISRALEPRMFDKLGPKRQSFSERSMFFMKDSTSTMFVVGRAVEYLDSMRDVLSLGYLNKEFSKTMRKKAFKRMLMDDKVRDDLRIKLWLTLGKLSLDGLPIIQSSGVAALDPRIAQIIKMDVKRTNFAKFNKEQLERLLLEIAAAFPLTTYYQGMNCIGGFLLNFTDSYQISISIFTFLMRKRLETYFLNNFERLKKMLYICERIIQIYVPKLHGRLEELKIGIEFYISPILLTVFTSSLQFIENYTLVAKIMDVFIARGWVGFFKVLVLVFRSIEKRILDKDYDKVLEFLNKGLYEVLFQTKFDSLKAMCNEVKISNKLIYQLGAEFDRTRLVVETYWTNYYEARRKAKEEELLAGASPNGTTVKSIGGESKGSL